MSTSYRISVDCGGTFTDGILLSDAHEVWVAKADSTPSDPKIGVVECISRLAAQVGLPLPGLLAATNTIVLGTTLATNIVATRTGAKTGAITTKGYRDRLSFLHVAKSDLGGDRKATAAELFSFRSDYPQPLTPRHLVAEVDERLNFKGEVLIPLRDDDVRQAVAYLRRKGVEAIAVNLLFSHLNPAHERRVEEIIKEDYPEAYVALSSRVLPTVGEVGRWSTTMFSAYVPPRPPSSSRASAICWPPMASPGLLPSCRATVGWQQVRWSARIRRLSSSPARRPDRLWESALAGPGASPIW